MTTETQKQKNPQQVAAKRPIVERFVMWLTPMKLEGYAFTDVVTGEGVYFYRDVYGQRWMKNSKYGLFKVRAN